MDQIEPDDGSSPARPTQPWCLFQCGSSGYAIGLDSVAEVVEIERLVRLPNSPPGVLGLCSLRREVIPVIGLNDPGAEPASPAAPAPPGLLVLILRTAKGSWGVTINPEGTIVADECLDDPEPIRAPGRPVFLGTVRRDETSYAAIDPEATWQSFRRGVEDWYDDRAGRDGASKTSKSAFVPMAG
jgi:purine-binding chemotaxis protein CheW